MPKYLVSFNQQWVGEHADDWWPGRGRLARAVDQEMRDAGVWVFSGGLEEEDEPVHHAAVVGAEPAADAPAEVVVRDGRYSPTAEFLGGFAIIDVPDDGTARWWAGKVAAACGWPHEVRRFKP